MAHDKNTFRLATITDRMIGPTETDFFLEQRLADSLGGAGTFEEEEALLALNSKQFNRLIAAGLVVIVTKDLRPRRLLL